MTGPPGWCSGLRHCIVVLAVPPETLDSSPGSVTAGRDRGAHGAAHNWPSVVRVKEGLADQVASCTVFPPTHWCVWLPGWMCIVSRSNAAWLGCVSEDAWLSTFAAPESVQELQ
jgi:hypothetical protein